MIEDSTWHHDIGQGVHTERKKGMGPRSELAHSAGNKPTKHQTKNSNFRACGTVNRHCFCRGGGPGPIHHHPQNQQPSSLDLRLPHRVGGSSSLSLSPSTLGGAGIRAGSLRAKSSGGRRHLYRSGVLNASNMSCACATVVSIAPGGRCGTCLPNSVITSVSTLTGLTSVCNALAHRSR